MAPVWVVDILHTLQYLWFLLGFLLSLGSLLVVLQHFVLQVWYFGCIFCMCTRGTFFLICARGTLLTLGPKNLYSNAARMRGSNSSELNAQIIVYFATYMYCTLSGFADTATAVFPPFEKHWGTASYPSNRYSCAMDRTERSRSRPSGSRLANRLLAYLKIKKNQAYTLYSTVLYDLELTNIHLDQAIDELGDKIKSTMQNGLLYIKASSATGPEFPLGPQQPSYPPPSRLLPQKQLNIYCTDACLNFS